MKKTKFDLWYIIFGLYLITNYITTESMKVEKEAEISDHPEVYIIFLLSGLILFFGVFIFLYIQKVIRIEKYRYLVWDYEYPERLKNYQKTTEPILYIVSIIGLMSISSLFYEVDTVLVIFLTILSVRIEE